MRVAGKHRGNVSTHYKPEAITSHFGNGERFGVEIRYVEEEDPLGFRYWLKIGWYGNFFLKLENRMLKVLHLYIHMKGKYLK